MRQAKWLNNGHYATDKKGNVYYRYDEHDKRPIKLDFIKDYGRNEEGFKIRGYNGVNMVIEKTNYYHYVRIGKTEKAVHVIIARNYPEICGEWFEGCVIHHKNGIKNDNRPENLQIMDQKAHTKWHSNTRILYDGVEYPSFRHATNYTRHPYWKIIKSDKLKILE